MTTVAEVAQDSARATQEMVADRENANMAYVRDQITKSVSALPYEGQVTGFYKSGNYLSTNVVDVEFPSYVEAVGWAQDNAMVGECTVVNPKSSLSQVCTLTFSLMGFVTRGRDL